MSSKEIEKVFAILFDIKKRVKQIEDQVSKEEYRKCRQSRSERSEELLHGEGPSG